MTSHISNPDSLILILIRRTDKIMSGSQNGDSNGHQKTRRWKTSDYFSIVEFISDHRKRSCACGEKVLVVLTKHVGFAAARSTELTPKPQQKSIFGQPP
jgi:hypothetical protein